MIDTTAHINPESVPESPVSLFLRGVLGLIQEKEAEVYRLQKHCAQMETEVQSLSKSSILADGKQNSLIAVLNAIYESGIVAGCTKSEFMQRMSEAFGAPGIANYAKALYNIKITYKYDEIFQRLCEIAMEEKKK